MSAFAHLHVHTQYSLLDGQCKTEDLMMRASELGIQSLAMTDHGVLYGAVDFYRAALKYGIKPLIGCELYLAARSRFEKVPHVDDDPAHLLVIAMNQEGYRNLIRLSSRAFMEGFYYKPRVDRELLASHSRGLVACSACLSGEIPRLITKGDLAGARELTGCYQEMFGKENFFLELQRNGIPEQDAVNATLVELAKSTGAPLVATNDVHYIRKGDAPTHDVLLCIQTQKTVEDKDRLRFPTDSFYLKSPEEMEREFGDVEEALRSASEIALRSSLALDLGGSYVPHYAVPAGYDADSYLAELCTQGLARRYSPVREEAKARLAYELDIIKKMGFSGYFLIVWDFIAYARARGIPVGPGRGSAPGSIVSYVLGITELDPLRHGLLFERFLNPERVTMPDIDVDFCFERRDEVIRYVTEKYGQDHTAQIITFGTMAARAAIRDVGRALNFPYAEVDKIAKLVPMELGATVDRALEVEAQLRAMYDSNDRVRRLIDTARAVEGLPRHASVHAAGVVISRDPLLDIVPLQKMNDGTIVTQFSMEDVEQVGLLKIDFLALRTLTVIKDTVEAIRESGAEAPDVEALPLDDKRTYAMLQAADSLGVFQLESSLFQGLLRDTRPARFEDIVAILALGRPGPMARIQDYVKQKHGEQETVYQHPRMKPILEETHGVMLYQEQVMQVARDLAGFTPGEADTLRRAMGKKKPEILAGMKAKFLEGCDRNGVSRSVANEIFELMEFFAGYGFNKSHSAAYALISYQTAYLKAHYPTEFMASILTSVMGSTDKVAIYIDECRQKGIEVLPPDVNESQADFAASSGKIRFGLAGVKNVGRGAVEAIIAARGRKGSFVSLADFCRKVDLASISKKAIESLVRCGAFDALGLARSRCLAVLDSAYDGAVAYQKQKAKGQQSFLDLMSGDSRDFGVAVPVPELEEYGQREKLAMEKELLGLYVSGHPLAAVADRLRRFATTTCARLPELQDQEQVTVAGIVTSWRKTMTKSGQAMAFVALEDLTGNVEVIVFPKVFERFARFIATDACMVVAGRLDAKEEGAKIICQALVPYRPDIVIVQLENGHVSRGSVEELKALLQKYAGECPVLVEYRPGPSVVAAGPELWVTPCRGLEEEVARYQSAQGEGVDGRAQTDRG